jgi:hypothetical protein
MPLPWLTLRTPLPWLTLRTHLLWLPTDTVTLPQLWDLTGMHRTVTLPQLWVLLPSRMLRCVMSHSASYLTKLTKISEEFALACDHVNEHTSPEHDMEF